MERPARRDGPAFGRLISLPSKVFEGKDSVKGNRQGSLSRGIKQLLKLV